jgi:hypothetical protein
LTRRGFDRAHRVSALWAGSSTRELHDVYTPDLAEVEWAHGVSRSDVHLLALVVLLNCFQRLGYFPKVEEIPAVVIQRVRGCLDLAADISVAPDRDRYERAGRLMLDPLGQAGGVERVSTDHAAISAHHGNAPVGTVGRQASPFRLILARLETRKSRISFRLSTPRTPLLLQPWREGLPVPGLPVLELIDPPTRRLLLF